MKFFKIYGGYPLVAYQGIYEFENEEQAKTFARNTSLEAMASLQGLEWFEKKTILEKNQMAQFKVEEIKYG